MRLVPGDQQRQFAVDRRITCRENVSHDFYLRQGRSPRARESSRERSAWVEWRTWKRTKSGDEDREGHLDAEQLRDLFDGERGGKLAGVNLRLQLANFCAYGGIATQPCGQALFQHGPHPFHLLFASPRRQFAR